MRTIYVGGTAIVAEVANTENLREQGLSGRAGLAPDSGMLFVFDTPGQWGIWMKDMKFAIDIAWLDAEGKVITFEQNVAPDTYPHIFYPVAPASYVLELPAGFAAAHGVAEGTQFVL